MIFAVLLLIILLVFLLFRAGLFSTRQDAYSDVPQASDVDAQSLIGARSPGDRASALHPLKQTKNALAAKPPFYQLLPASTVALGPRTAPAPPPLQDMPLPARIYEAPAMLANTPIAIGPSALADLSPPLVQGGDAWTAPPDFYWWPPVVIVGSTGSTPPTPAVPEMASWLMMLTGMLFIGVSLRVGLAGKSAEHGAAGKGDRA